MVYFTIRQLNPRVFLLFYEVYGIAHESHIEDVQSSLYCNSNEPTRHSQSNVLGNTMNLLQLSTITLALVIVPATAQTVQFDIQSIKHNDGKLYIQLFKGEHDYNSGKPYNASIVKAKEGTISVTFNDIEAGDYAIRYFHDENDNGSMDTNLFGLPVEGYGFSNNAIVRFGPPSYEEMAFTVAQQPVKTYSTINY